MRHITGSTLRIESFLAMQESAQKLTLLKKFEIRWNTVHDMLKRAFDLRDTIDQWIVVELSATGQLLRTRKALKAMQLRTREWTYVEELVEFLAPFKQTTEKVSSSTSPILHRILPVFHNLERHLERFRDPEMVSFAISEEVEAMVSCGLEKLRKYQEKTTGDGGLYYNLALILDPTRKLEPYGEDGSFSQESRAYHQDQVKQYAVENYDPRGAETESSDSGMFLSSFAFASCINIP